MEIIHECNICYKSFTREYLLTRHINKIKSCDIIDKVVNNLDENIERINVKIKNNDDLSFETKNKCIYCNNSFHNKSNLKRHILFTCDQRKIFIQQKEKYENVKLDKLNEKNNNKIKITNIIKDKDDEIKKLKKEIKILEKNRKIINTQNTQNIGVVVNNINNQLNINPFGSEDLSHITNNDYKKYLSNLSPGLLKFIEDIHFSDKMPSNWNICIPKLESKYIAIFEKNKWNIKDKNDIFKKILTKRVTSLDNKCEEFQNNGLIDEKIVDLYDEYINLIYEKDEEKKKIKDNLDLMIFNNRNKIDNYNKLLK